MTDYSDALHVRAERSLELSSQVEPLSQGTYRARCRSYSRSLRTSHYAATGEPSI